VKREVVGEMVARGVSERLACRAVGLQRSSFRYRPERKARHPASEQELHKKIIDLAHKHRRFGYRRVTALLRRQGERLNHKRVWRIWRAEQLSLPRRRPKKRAKLDAAKAAAAPTKAEHRGQVWSYDFIFDWTERGQQLKMLGVLDEYTRECHKIKVGLQLNSGDVKAVLAELFAAQGAPEYIRSDNGGEFIATELAGWLQQQGVQTVHIAPGHPWENGFAESFNGKFRDECLNQEIFWNERHAQVVVEKWRRWYEEERPHSALGYRTPKEVARETMTGVNVDNSSRCPDSHRPYYDDGAWPSATAAEATIRSSDG
jgi:transposase InsO family protein